MEKVFAAIHRAGAADDAIHLVDPGGSAIGGPAALYD
jgi:hypothetical protein